MYEFRIRWKLLVWDEYYNEFGIYQTFQYIPLRTTKNNLSNPEECSEPCQTSKMESFAKMVNSYWNLLTIFIKHSVLDASQSSEYASVISYSLFGKTEDPKNIDLVEM